MAENVTEPVVQNNGAPEIRGEAGYETPYPYMERLQEKMEERIARKVPVKGRFCGFCYARLREADAACPFCGNQIASVGTVDEIRHSTDPVVRQFIEGRATIDDADLVKAS